MRSATSWLNGQLGRHPDLWLPPVKELHYFDTDDGGILSRRWRKDLPRLFRRAWKQKRWLTSWERRFLFSRKNDDWYSSLFWEGSRAGKITGEITPAYAVLSEERIRQVHALNPEMKILFLMRDPIDRTWSSAMKRLCRDRNRRLEDVAAGEFLFKFKNVLTIRKSLYTSTIQKWESVFPPGQIFYGFFEEVQNSPGDLLGRIFSFLGVDPAAASSPDLHKIRNPAATGTSIPLEFERLLAQSFLEETAALARRFGGHTLGWHDRCRRLAQDKY